MPPVPKIRRIRRPTFLRQWREIKGLSQERMADRVGMSRENYGRIESGKVPYNQDVLELMADALNCTVTDLLERDPLVERQVDELRALLEEADPKDRKRAISALKNFLSTGS